MTAKMLGFLFRLVVIPFDIGACFTTSRGWYCVFAASVTGYPLSPERK
jgi:hypothetical protein